MLVAIVREGDMSAIVVQNIEINQGEDWSFQWTVKDPVTGDPLDISAWTGKGQIRLRPGDATLLYEWNTSSGNMTLGIDGTCKISVPKAVSSAWTWGAVFARYDVELTGGGKTVRLAEGIASLSLEVTI
jgi:hypothetical protein